MVNVAFPMVNPGVNGSMNEILETRTVSGDAV